MAKEQTAGEKRAGVIGVVVLIGVFVIAFKACGSDGGGGSSGGSSSSAAFVKKIKAHAQSTASDVRLVLQKVVNSDTDGNYVNVAANAQTLHDNLGQFREELIAAADTDDNDQLALVDAENQIKSGIGTIDRWTDDPTSPSLSALWARQVGNGVGEWNTAVRKIWAKAHVSPVPTIVIPRP